MLRLSKNISQQSSAWGKLKRIFQKLNRSKHAHCIFSTEAHIQCRLQNSRFQMQNLPEVLHSSTQFPRKTMFTYIIIINSNRHFSDSSLTISNYHPSSFEQAHMEKHRDDKTAQENPKSKCNYCGIIPSSSESLSEHIVQHQKRPNFQCLVCEFKGNTNNQLKSHMRSHVSNLYPNGLNCNLTTFHPWRQCRPNSCDISANYAAKHFMTQVRFIRTWNITIN